MTDMLAAGDPIFSTLGGDADLSDLVEMFVNEIPDRMATLAAQFSAHDLTELGRTAHQLKGAAGSYGFACITPVAARLESVAKAREPEDVIRAALDELIALCGRLRAGTGD
jgi:HPt (histidine-containing phosphotransfer) domain-containing protein